MDSPSRSGFFLTLLACGFCLLTDANAASLTFNTPQAYGNFNGVEFARYTGRIEGETARGAYDVPFEIVAAKNPAYGNGAVIVEPAHWFFGPGAPDQILGEQLLYGSGFSYAAVGWGHNGLNVLDPSAAPIIVAGAEVVDPGEINLGSPADSEIVVQFVNELKSDPYAVAILGADLLWYSFGFSQTSGTQLQIMLGPHGPGLFDFNLVVQRFWPEFLEPHNFTRLAGDFQAPAGVGRTIFVNTESELVRSEAEQFRIAADDADYRVYELAGAPHFPQPPPLNPLPINPAFRAAFVAGDAWVRLGVEPPSNRFIEETAGIDPIYGFETGIARDFNGNALGGVRMPDVEVGRATYIATNFIVPIPGFEAQLFGLYIDLHCEPLPDGSVRFPDHGSYVSAVAGHANQLVREGYLLPDDAEVIRDQAGQSEVGKPGSCN